MKRDEDAAYKKFIIAKLLKKIGWINLKYGHNNLTVGEIWTIQNFH